MSTSDATGEVDRMNPTVRAEWVRRLRSGDYRQGHDRLVVPDDERALVVDDATGAATPRYRYCCLGVLCEVARDAGVVRFDATRLGYAFVATDDATNVRVETTGDGDDEYDERHATSTWYFKLLPHDVVVWAGLRNEDPTIDGRPLSAWNDVERADLTTIADLVERNL